MDEGSDAVAGQVSERTDDGDGLADTHGTLGGGEGGGGLRFQGVARVAEGFYGFHGTGWAIG